MLQQRIGNFSLVAPLPSHGVASRVYTARHHNDTEHAETPAYLVKLLLPATGEAAEHLRAQFEHEIALLSAFNHPAIPSVHEEGVVDGIRYIVMDYIEGVDLATLLGHHENAPRGLSKEIAVYIMGQLADALRYVHGFAHLDRATGVETPLGLVHRDIAPSNVVLSRHGDVLLVDYNSARGAWLAPEHDMGQTGQKAYMAPERIIGTTDATPLSDLFSMAVILWEMLKGQRCFKAETELKTMDAIVRFDISHSGRRVTGLSSKLSEIVRKNLDRDPSRRYSGAYQMLQRLAQSPEARSAEQARAQLAALVAGAITR